MSRMPISKTDWELLIERKRVDTRGTRKRTVGRYQVYHDGRAVSGLSGVVAETRGPGDNSRPGNNRRIEAGRYPLLTQDGTNYVTIGYTPNRNPAAIPRPGLELGKTGKRSEILFHPGRGFLSSVGCINPARTLANANSDIDFEDSRKRVIAVIDDLKSYLGSSFPGRNGKPIPKATVVIDGEP